MIKCYFVDIKDISSDLPRSNFAEADLEQLATLILATDGLIRPLIVKESGAEKYQVVAGHLEYYAALKAKEKNISKAEMVNAFVINDKIQASAIEQLQLLTADRSPVTTTPIASDLDQLLPTIVAAISQQIQPLVDQLAEQKKLLEVLTLDRLATANIQPIPPIQPIPSIQPPKSIEVAPTPIPATVVEPKPTKVAKAKPETIKPDKPPKTPKTTKVKPETIKSAQSQSAQSQPAKVTTSKATKTATLLASIDPVKATNTLILINTLSQDDLIIKMERSGVSKAVIKLVPNIIASRDIQPDRKFDDWETISALKIKGLGDAAIKAVIEKLK
jgi:outer membrane biosynthesis protein TonB